ncbi:MAG: hypothetical protein HY858_16420 [Candidatus Solibacter usitatus]|nr:hypothetical protein [Candidatus Solibacter usitatus]
MNRLAACLALGGGLSLFPLYADFTYQQTSKITGGTIVRMMKLVPGGGKALEPQNSTVIVKGDRLATVSDRNIHIIDLDKEVMIEIDIEKKTYAAITFAEYKQALLAMQEKMAQQMKQAKGAEMNFKFDVKETGATRNIIGLDTKQVLLTLAMETKDPQSGQAGEMQFLNDMWLAKGISGYGEVRDFYRRFAEKLAYDINMMRMGGMMMSQPGMSEGMAKMAKEAAKLEGVPVVQITRILGMGGPGGQMPEMPSGADVNTAMKEGVEQEAAGSAARSVGGRFGGLAGAAAGGMLGGLGRKKKEAPKDDQPPVQQPRKETAPAGPAAFMEMTTELASFSSGPVDLSKFSVPAGFKEIEHPMKKAVREVNKR